jgi:CPA2 family monovalent cation:H+ antiporter-2
MESTSLNASFFQLGILLFVSLLFGSIVAYFGLPSVIGYLLAGLGLGPQGLGIVTDRTLIDYISELGVLLLLFYMGLEISLKKFSKAGAYALFLAPIKIGVGFALGFLIMKAFGYPSVLGIAFGSAVAVSSTAIISQIILDKHWQDSLEAGVALAMLILEDIFSVFVIGYLLGAEGSVSVGKILLNSAVILFILFAIGNRLSKRLLAIIMGFGKPEHFSLYAFSLLLVFSYGVSYLGMSPLLGAFFAGMLLSETAHAKRIEEELAGFRKLFVVIFFTALGLKYQISFGLNAWILAGLGLLIFFVQRIILLGVGPFFGLEPKRSAKLSVLLLPAGEFALFIAASIQGIHFADPAVLEYFHLTTAQAKIVETVAPDIMGATFILILITTILAGILLRDDEKTVNAMARWVPKSLVSFAEQLRPYLTAMSNAQRGTALSAAIERKTERIVEMFLVLIALSYITGYAMTQYPHHGLQIAVAGFLLSTYPLFSIIRAFYEIMEHYAEEITRYSPLPLEMSRELAKSLAYVLVGTLIFEVKAEVVEEQFLVYRRSYDVPPPALSTESKWHPIHDENIKMLIQNYFLQLKV